LSSIWTGFTAMFLTTKCDNSIGSLNLADVGKI
jgi:hypothetical protein